MWDGNKGFPCNQDSGSEIWVLNRGHRSRSPAPGSSKHPLCRPCPHPALIAKAPVHRLMSSSMFQAQRIAGALAKRMHKAPGHRFLSQGTSASSASEDTADKARKVSQEGIAADC